MLSRPTRCPSEIALYRLDGSIFFGAADRVLDQVQAGSGTEVIILRMSQVSFLDATGAHKLADLVTTLERRGITVLVKGIRQIHLKLATTAGLVGSLRHPNHLFEDLDAAVAHARSHIERAAAGDNVAVRAVVNDPPRPVSGT